MSSAVQYICNKTEILYNKQTNRTGMPVKYRKSYVVWKAEDCDIN